MASKLARMRKALQCPVCLDNLKKPKLLGCSHRLCRGCLHGLIMSKDTGTAHIVQCPYCREEADITDMVGGKPREEWVDVFRDDRLLTDMTEYLQSIDTCEKHGEEPFWIYCIDCKVPLCHVCYRVDHQDHKTCSLEVKAKTRRSFYNELLASCNLRLEDIENRTNLSPNATQIVANYNNAIESLAQEYKKVKILLREMENKSLNEIESRYEKEFVLCLLSEKEQNQNMVAKLKDIISNTSDAAVVAKELKLE